MRIDPSLRIERPFEFSPSVAAIRPGGRVSIDLEAVDGALHRPELLDDSSPGFALLSNEPTARGARIVMQHDAGPDYGPITMAVRSGRDVYEVRALVEPESPNEDELGRRHLFVAAVPGERLLVDPRPRAKRAIHYPDRFGLHPSIDASALVEVLVPMELLDDMYTNVVVDGYVLQLRGEASLGEALPHWLDANQ